MKESDQCRGIPVIVIRSFGSCSRTLLLIGIFEFKTAISADESYSVNLNLEDFFVSKSKLSFSTMISIQVVGVGHQPGNNFLSLFRNVVTPWLTTFLPVPVPVLDIFESTPLIWDPGFRTNSHNLCNRIEATMVTKLRLRSRIERFWCLSTTGVVASLHKIIFCLPNLVLFLSQFWLLIAISRLEICSSSVWSSEFARFPDRHNSWGSNTISKLWYSCLVGGGGITFQFCYGPEYTIVDVKGVISGQENIRETTHRPVVYRIRMPWAWREFKTSVPKR